jgi:hypothetical protein
MIENYRTLVIMEIIYERSRSETRFSKIGLSPGKYNFKMINICLVLRFLATLFSFAQTDVTGK